MYFFFLFFFYFKQNNKNNFLNRALLFFTHVQHRPIQTKRVYPLKYTHQNTNGLLGLFISDIRDS